MKKSIFALTILAASVAGTAARAGDHACQEPQALTQAADTAADEADREIAYAEAEQDFALRLDEVGLDGSTLWQSTLDSGSAAVDSAAIDRLPVAPESASLKATPAAYPGWGREPKP